MRFNTVQYRLYPLAIKSSSSQVVGIAAINFSTAWASFDPHLDDMPSQKAGMPLEVIIRTLNSNRSRDYNPPPREQYRNTPTLVRLNMALPRYPCAPHTKPRTAAVFAAGLPVDTQQSRFFLPAPAKYDHNAISKTSHALTSNKSLERGWQNRTIRMEYLSPAVASNVQPTATA
jgi:hypothetical protein